MKRHRLKVRGSKAEELKSTGRALICPRCTKETALVPVSTFRADNGGPGVWVHVGDVCPQCGYEFNLRDAPN